MQLNLFIFSCFKANEDSTLISFYISDFNGTSIDIFYSSHKLSSCSSTGSLVMETTTQCVRQIVYADLPGEFVIIHKGRTIN